MAEESRSRSQGAQRPAILEWLVGGIGLVLTLGLVGFIGWEAVTGSNGTPPGIELRVEDVSAAGPGYVATIVARNTGPRTAASVEIEGKLSRRGGESETSTVTIDYVPGGSEVRGGLYFTQDPSAGQLQLRALGYTQP